jgi:hypothetical protein
MIIVTYMLYGFIWIVTRVLRDVLAGKLLVDGIAVIGLYFITKFFIENTY